jgi:cell division control protein 24
MSTTISLHRPTMSASGSISRKRVGSVSQRGNEIGLAPLDIQSIQMPSNPYVTAITIESFSLTPSQNALALKTAALASTKSLYQTCSTLRKRLRCVDDFAPFLGAFFWCPLIITTLAELSEQPTDAESLDVVSHMCHLFRLGSPLCHLYNLLIPTFSDPSSPLFAPGPEPKRIEYDFPRFYDSPEGVKNWAKRPENAKQCQKYIAMFCMAMKQRQSEGRWHMEMWALHELWGKSSGEEAEGYDSTGLMKVLQTVEAILDCLPESAMSPLSPTTPYTASTSMHVARQSYDLPFSLGGNGSGLTAVANMAATMNGGVHVDMATSTMSPGTRSTEDVARGLSRSSADDNAFKSVEELVASEKSYVQELEILVRCSTEMLENQLISTETNHQMFSNLSKILDFHVRPFVVDLGRLLY